MSNFEKLYSATSVENLRSILAEGLRSGSYWTDNTDVAAYYRETIEDEGKQPITLQVDFSALDLSYIKPDVNGIVEPLTYTLGVTEEEVSDAWDNSDQSWVASMQIIGSLRYMKVIPSDFLRIELDDGSTLSVKEYLAAAN
jgi:hypothetical protein